MIVVVGILPVATAIIGALLFYFIWYGWNEFSSAVATFMHHVMGGLPFPIDKLAFAFEQWLLITENWVVGNFRNRVYGGVQATEKHMDVIANNQRTLATSDRQVHAALAESIAVKTNPNNLTSTLASREYVDGKISEAEQDVSNLVTHAFTTEDNRVTDVYNTLSDYEYQRAQELTASIDTAISNEQQDVTNLNALILAEQERTDDEVGQQRDYAISTAENYADDIDHKLSDSISNVNDNLNQRISDTQDWTKGRLDDLDQTLTGAIAATTAELETQVMPRVATLESNWDNCGKPICDNLLDFSKGFGEIAQLLATGAFIAFLAGAVADPEGVAHETNSVVQTVSRPIEEAAKSLLGIG